MQLRVNDVQLPAPITFNYDELKRELLSKAADYSKMTYTDDQIKLAKEDRANLNRLKKSLNDERLRREREYLQPFAAFKAQINEIISIIDKPCVVIDRQIKAYEEAQRNEKCAALLAFYNELELPGGTTRPDPSLILEDKWLNASVSLKNAQAFISAKLGQYIADLAVVRGLPHYAFEAEQELIATLDLSKAVSEAHRLQESAERKSAWEAEQDAKKAAKAASIAQEAMPMPIDVSPSQPSASDEESSEEDDTDEDIASRQWIAFKCLLSMPEAYALGNYLRSQNITYKSIRGSELKGEQ